MARYKNGINGSLSGTVGSVIASSWRGINYLKGRQEPSDKPPSAAQLRQRQVMSLASGWLKPLKQFIMVGYQHVLEAKTPMNEAVSFVMREAMIFEAEEPRIDFSKAVVSKGELLISTIKSVELLPKVVMHIAWEDALPSAYCKADDLATFILYNPVKEQFVAFDQAAARQEKQALLQLPTSFIGDSLHCYMYYVNRKGNAVSTSQYFSFENLYSSLLND